MNKTHQQPRFRPAKPGVIPAARELRGNGLQATF
jgi:hypothetical protein